MRLLEIKNHLEKLGLKIRYEKSLEKDLKNLEIEEINIWSYVTFNGFGDPYVGVNLFVEKDEVYENLDMKYIYRE